MVAAGFMYKKRSDKDSNVMQDNMCTGTHKTSCTHIISFWRKIPECCTVSFGFFASHSIFLQRTQSSGQLSNHGGQSPRVPHWSSGAAWLLASSNKIFSWGLWGWADNGGRAHIPTYPSGLAPALGLHSPALHLDSILQWMM